MKRSWTHWDWRLRPELPLTWGFPDQMVVLVEDLLPARAGYSSLAAVARQRTSWIDVVALCKHGGVVVVAERDPLALRAWPEDAPKGLVPALRAKKQADLDTPDIAALLETKASCRALVCSGLVIPPAGWRGVGGPLGVEVLLRGEVPEGLVGACAA